MKVNMKSIPKNSKTPILSYCRSLIKKGADLQESLEIYRNSSDWDFRVNNIGQAAKLTVLETVEVGPVFAKMDVRDLHSRTQKYNKSKGTSI